MTKSVKSCAWVGDDPAMIAYHDKEWGVPVHNDRAFFEFLILEGAQAGLTWRTVLNKRENYRRAFSGFDAKKISRFGIKEMEKLINDSGIIRNKLKIVSTIENAKQFLKIQEEFGSFDSFIWQFVSGRTINSKIKSIKEIPATTKVSDLMSKELLRRGFKFVGPTICYAFMQAVGLVNDHEMSCFRYKELILKNK